MSAIWCILPQVACIAVTDLSAEAYFSVISEQSAAKAIILHLEKDSQKNETHVMVMSETQEFGNRVKIYLAGRSMTPRRFIFSSYLPITEILTRQSHYIPSEFSVDNLLYANLKLERLFIEYEGLRERGQSILKGLDVPYLYGSKNFKNLIEKKNGGVNQSLNRVAKQTTSLAGPLVNSDRWKEQKNFSTSTNGHQTEIKQLLTPVRRGLSYSSKDPSIVDSATQDKPGRTTGAAPDPAEAIQPFQYGVQKEDQLPWLARAVRSLSKYISENKVEAIVFILFLFTAHQIIFSSRK